MWQRTVYSRITLVSLPVPLSTALRGLHSQLAELFVFRSCLAIHHYWEVRVVCKVSENIFLFVLGVVFLTFFGCCFWPVLGRLEADQEMEESGGAEPSNARCGIPKILLKLS